MGRRRKEKDNEPCFEGVESASAVRSRDSRGRVDASVDVEPSERWDAVKGPGPWGHPRDFEEWS